MKILKFQQLKSGIHSSHRICEIIYSEFFKTVVDDILALNKSSVVVSSLVSKGTYTLKNLFGKKTVESFSSRTCVKPKLLENRFGQAEIKYESLTAQDLLWKITLIIYINLFQ